MCRYWFLFALVLLLERRAKALHVFFSLWIMLRQHNWDRPAEEFPKKERKKKKFISTLIKSVISPLLAVRFINLSSCQKQP